MANTVELMGSVICPFVQRVHITLIEKAIDYKFIPIDLQNKPAWFKEISPYGKVPVFHHNDAYLYESSVINEYIEEVFPTPALLPLDPLLRAKIRAWISYCNDQFITHFYKLLLNQDATKQALLTNNLIDSFNFIEQEGMQKLSKDGPFWLGAKLTLLDTTFYPFFERFPMLQHYRGVKIPEHCQRIKNWITVMQKQPSVIKTANTVDTYLKAYAKYADNSVNTTTANEIRDK